MNPTPQQVLKARSRIAHQIAEQLPARFPNLQHRTSGYDIDAARRLITTLIPMSNAEADAEMSLLKDAYDASPRQPSMVQPLRDAVGLQKGSIKDVLLTAAELIADLRESVTIAREARDTAESRAKASVQAEMAALRAENARLTTINAALNDEADKQIVRYAEALSEAIRHKQAADDAKAGRLRDLKEIALYKGGDRFDDGCDFAAIHRFVKGRIEQLTPADSGAVPAK